MPGNDLLDNLTKPQHAAVSHVDGPLLVLAGAGSGKTRVITRRAAHIARTVARPDQVLAITFTNRAAGEMRERIGALGAGRRMWVCTFHSLCVRLLRAYGHAIGISPNFSIFDDADSRALVRKAIESCDLSSDNWQPRTLLNAISSAKTQILSPGEYAARAYDFTEKSVARVYAEYQRMLTEQNACDFDDLLMHTAKMLGDHDAIRLELADRFRYLLIDEYQDTNHAQYLIATRLAETHRNICATGDPDQSIYAWRGADISNILDFEADYPDATVVRLEQNFRSTGAILSAASTLIAANERRKHKDLWTDGERGPSVRIWTCEDEQLEAQRIAADVAAYCQEGGRPGDMAVFYRVNALTRVLEDAFRKAGVAYQIARGVEFYARKEIKDVLSYLRLIANPADETAVLRAINTPARGIGKTTIGRLQAAARAGEITLDEAVATAGDNAELKTAAKKRIGVFAELVQTLRRLPASPVCSVVEAVVKESGIEKSLSNSADMDNEPLENVYELITAARQYDQENPDGSLIEWLQQISLVSDLDAIEMNGGAVTFMTLHAAKGLEFPVVYIVGLEEGLLPHRRTLSEDASAVEEERRLTFVGITRAMQRLTLSHANYRMVRGITERTVASRFVRELPADELEHEVFEHERDRSRAHLGRHNEESLDIDDAMYFPGCRVRHDEYGEGQVLRIERRLKSRTIRILFRDVGERSFALEHVSLYIIDV